MLRQNVPSFERVAAGDRAFFTLIDVHKVGPVRAAFQRDDREHFATSSRDPKGQRGRHPPGGLVSDRGRIHCATEAPTRCAVSPGASTPPTFPAFPLES